MSNTISALVPQLLAKGLLALRDVAIAPAVVNRGYERLAGQRGSTIDVPIPSAITATAVTPSNTPPASVDVAPTSVQIPLDQWYEAPFHLTDKEMLEVRDDIMPMQASEAIKALANNVNDYILGLYPSIYGYAGTAGTTPFASDTSAATEARKVLNTQLAPLGDRRMLIDPEAEANALGIRAFQDASFGGGASALREGQITRKLGFDWFMHQRMPTHTAGTASGATTDNAGYAVGVKTVTLASAGTGTILVGDIFTIAGDAQTYVVTSGDADVSGGGTVSFEPGLQIAIATSATAITLKASHTVNLAMHRDCIAFASRPLDATVDAGLGSIVRSAVDPLSGLALRLEVTREHRQTKWSYDILYGGLVVRPELGARLAG